ncbi:anti-sigma regulatory factor [Falsiroseomonas sp. HW251]|uniref:anti-sigma regulatory factor n=1 Tax=Falsiroseomonas sp. HW251 TaxID=3390998 RepID=UPI003D3243B4
MSTTASDIVAIRTGDDVVRVRQEVRAMATRAALSLVDQTKIVTAASELARNTLDYGGGGTARIMLLQEGARRGVRVIFEDQGPGIPDVEQALRDGFTTGRGLGLGLGGSKRLCNEFRIETELGKGTRITIARWR